MFAEYLKLSGLDFGLTLLQDISENNDGLMFLPKHNTHTEV